MSYLSLHFPFLNTERLSPHKPLVLTKNGVVVHAAKELPQIKSGMPIAVARAIYPSLIEEEFKEDFEYIKKIALWITKTISPLCGIHKENGITINLTGTERLYPDKEKLVSKLLSVFKKKNITTNFAFASNPALSFAYARFLVNDFKLLPIDALSVKDEVKSSLYSLGINTISDLLALPRKKLGIRFGKELLVSLLTLEGALSSPLLTPPIPVIYEAKKRLEYPVQNKEILKKLLSSLLQDCFKKLNNQKARLFRITLEDDTKDLPIFYYKQDWIHSLVLNLIDIWKIHRPISWAHIKAFGIHTENNQNEEDKIFSEIKAYKFEFKESYIPENSFVLKRKDFLEPIIPKNLPDLDRPSMLIHPPKKIKAISLLPDNPPTLIILENKKLKLKKGFGPEVILGEWWKGDRQKREYFKVQNEEGLWLWIYRQNSEWFLHGVWS
jgi:protein ImuB